MSVFRRRPAAPRERTRVAWSRLTVRRSFGRLVSDYQRHILTAGGVVAFVLACWGYWRYLPSPKVTDVVYLSLKTFLLNAPYYTQLPWQADVARFLAPAVTGWAGLSALGSLFRDRAQQMRVPLMRNHVVVCGLGYVGVAFLLSLERAGVRAVAIEADADNRNIDLCRSLGVPVIIDAQRQRTLQSAGIDHADRLLAVTPDDSTNTQIVASAQSSLRRSSQLGCLARITDANLCAMLRVHEAETGDLSLDFIHLPALGAQLLLDSFPVFSRTGAPINADARSARPHMLVARPDLMGPWLVYHAAREWHDIREPGNDDRLVVTVVDEQAEDCVASTLAQHPVLETVCEFIPQTTSVRDISRLTAHHAESALPPVSRAYVTSFNDAEGFETAVRLRHELDANVRLVLNVWETHGVAGLLTTVRDTEKLYHFDIFPMLARTCTAELVRSGSTEALARAIHGCPASLHLAHGEPAKNWDELDDADREPYREQARHMTLMLRSVGCASAPLTNWDATDFTFTTTEIDTLAGIKHDLWRRQRLERGWSLGNLDAKRKTRPNLLRWEELPADVAELHRAFVRAVPALLASIGQQVVRTPRRSVAPPIELIPRSA